MVGKVYFLIAAFVLLFSIYYQMVLTGFKPDFYNSFQIIVNLILILGGYSYFFKKRVFEAEFWRKYAYVLGFSLILSLILQFMPRLLKGDFGIYYFNLETNLLGFLLGVIPLIPLYIAVYNLTYNKSSSANKK